MYAAIHLVEFGLQARLRRLLEAGLAETPVALLDTADDADDAEAGRKKAPIVALTAAARRAGVEPGMTAVKGLARCGALRVLVRCPEAEREAGQLLATLAERCTPDFEETAPGVVTLDLFGSRQWSGGGREAELGRRVVAELAAQRLHARVGFAENPDLALLVAKRAPAAEPVAVLAARAEEARDFLAPLPVAALEPPPRITEVLSLWGVRTLGDFTRLRKDEIADRLGPEGVALWECAAGRRQRLLRLVRPVPEFAREMEFDYEVETLEPLLFALRRLLETLCARLAADWKAAGEIRLRLDFSRGEPYARDFRVPDPCCDVDLLFRMLHAHLEDFTADSPIVGLRLEALPARVGKQQVHLFESGLKDPNRFTETLARLEALLGSGRVGTPELPDTHRPDAFELQPFRERQPGEEERKKKKKTHPDTTTAALAREPVPHTPVRLGLPLHRFRPPLQAGVTLSRESKRPAAIHSGGIRGTVRDCRGPWLTSGDWWDRARWSRLEWDIQLADGRIYLLVKEEEHWKLEGVYG